MILTRMDLNARRAGARKLVASPQAMHAALLSGFPPDVEAGRVLWRLDQGASLHPRLWMVSAATPDLTHLEEQAGWPNQPTHRSIHYGGLLEALTEGQTWAFRVTVNPTHRADHGGRKKVFAHVTADQQVGWLLSRQERMGARLVDDADEPSFALVGREHKRFRRGADQVTLGAATFDGTLVVTDAGALRETLTAGLGRAKAYGCGLLTLARP